MEVLKLNWKDPVPNNYTGIVEWNDGVKEWYKDGLLHQENGPAIEWKNEKKEWWVEGKRHRIDGPAIENKNGYKEWYVDNKFYSVFELETYVEKLIFLGKEKGKYGLKWLKFLTEEGIKEFPIIPGMEKDLIFKEVFAYLGI